MMRLFAFFALIASASAFVPPQQAGKLKCYLVCSVGGRSWLSGAVSE